MKTTSVRCATEGCKRRAYYHIREGQFETCIPCAWVRHDAEVAAEAARRLREWPDCTECGKKVDVDRFPGDAQCGFKCRRAAAKRAAGTGTA